MKMQLYPCLSTDPHRTTTATHASGIPMSTASDLADHFKVGLATSSGLMDAMGWGMAARASTLAVGSRIDIAYKLDVNEFQGKRTLQVVLQDFRPCPDV